MICIGQYCQLAISCLPILSTRAHVVVALEVVQCRVATEDGQNRAFEFDAQPVSVFISNVYIGR